MLSRRAALLAFFATLLRGDEQAELTKWLGSVVNRLTEENPSDFLRVLEKSLRDKLETNIWALVRAAEISSSVEILEIKGDGQARELVVDWYLDLKPRATSTPSEQRRHQVKLKIERAKKGWTILTLEPLEFFRPL